MTFIKNALLLGLIPLSLCFLDSCLTHHKTETTEVRQDRTDDIKNKSGAKATQPVIIYKTKSEYFDKVPVILSVDKSEIVSYPARTDVYYQGILSFPTRLTQGYLLDNRGINANVAFTDFPYELYSKISQAVDPQELKEHLLDVDPLLEMYSCKCRRDTAEINEIIRNGKLKNCKKLK